MKRYVIAILTVVLMATITFAAMTHPAAAINWSSERTYSDFPANPLKLWVEEAETKINTGQVGGTSKICTTAVTLTAAQIKALYTTARAIVPAQGANTEIEVLGCTLYYKYGTAAYSITSATNLALKYVDKSGTACSGTVAVTGLLDQTVNMSAKILPVAVAASAVAVNVNVPVCLTLAGADPTGSTSVGTLKCIVTYAVHSTDF